MKHHSRVYSHIFRTCSIPGIFRTLNIQKGCAICSSESSSSFSSSPSVITSADCSENPETIYSTDNGRDWLVQVESVLLGTLNGMATSLLGRFFQTLSVLHTLFLKSLRYASFL